MSLRMLSRERVAVKNISELEIINKYGILSLFIFSSATRRNNDGKITRKWQG